MNFNRRTFIKTSSLITAGLFLPSNKLLAALQDEEGNMQLLRNNVGQFTEKGGTIGWLISDDAVIVVDTQFPDSAKHFITKMMEKTKRKIDFVINTHHHSDHTSGNFMMNKLSDKIVAHERAVELQRKFYGEGENAQSQVYANVTFSDEWSAVVGKEKITAKHFGNAHTGGDAYIHFENSNVVHVGDLVFNRVYPYMDRPAGTSITGWINYLDIIIEQFDNDTIFIFGHGTKVNGNKNDLKYMKDYLSSLWDYVDKQVKNGDSLEKVVESGPVPGFENHVAAWEGALQMNLKATYEEITS